MSLRAFFGLSCFLTVILTSCGTSPGDSAIPDDDRQAYAGGDADVDASLFGDLADDFEQLADADDVESDLAEEVADDSSHEPDSTEEEVAEDSSHEPDSTEEEVTEDTVEDPDEASDAVTDPDVIDADDTGPPTLEPTCGFVSNGDAELGNTSGWTMREGSFEAVEGSRSTPSAHTGSYSFFAGETAAAEAAQTIDLGSWATHIDDNSLYFVFSSYVRTWAGDDAAVLIAIAEDAEGTELGRIRSGKYNDESWQLASVELPLPTGTRAVTVVLRGERSRGADNDAYFDDVDGCIDLEAAPADPNDLRGPPYLMWVTQTGVSVRWETSDPVVGTVHYGLDEEMSSVASEADARTTHEIRLTDLVPSSDYFYTIELGERRLPVASFRTAPAADDDSPFTFLVWGDNQDGPDNFRRNVANMVEEDAAFAISTGDCVQTGSRGDFRSQLFRPISPLASEVPFLVASGNHEYYYSRDNIALWEEYMSQPEGEHCFGWRYGEVFFMIIDSDKPLGDGTNQATCINNALTSEAATSATFRVAAYHRPPRVQWWGGGAFAWGFIDVPEVMTWLEPTLDSLDVDLIFNGHNHLFLTATTDSGLEYITTGGGGGSLDTVGTFNKVQDWDEITTQIHEHHYLTVTVDSGVMSVTAVNIDGNVIHEVSYGGE